MPEVGHSAAGRGRLHPAEALLGRAGLGCAHTLKFVFFFLSQPTGAINIGLLTLGNNSNQQANQNSFLTGTLL
jgi:hypothetical protein